MDPIQELRQEHEAILSMLDIIDAYADRAERGQGADTEDAAAMVDFIKTFADRCHHGKEEERLFPFMESAGVPREQGPIGVMLHEHCLGRDHVAQMAKAVSELASHPATFAAAFVPAAKEYAALLRQHISKENMVLFPMADRLIDPSTRAELERVFADVENERLGQAKREHYSALLGRLCAKYLGKGTVEE